MVVEFKISFLVIQDTYDTELKIVVLRDKMTAMEPTTGGGSLPSQWPRFTGIHRKGGGANDSL